MMTGKEVYYPDKFIDSTHKDVRSTIDDEKKNNIVNQDELIKKQLEFISKKERKSKLESYKKNNYVNIDSSKRNIHSKNITEGNYILLNENPISIEKDTNRMFFKTTTRNLKKIDNITILDVDTKNVILNKALIFINNFDFLIINHKNHNILSDYKKYNDKFEIEISNMKTKNNFIGNIPINIINGIHDILLYNEIIEYYNNMNNSHQITNLIKQLSNNTLNNSDDITNIIKDDYYFIKLPISFTYEDEIFIYNNNINLKFLNIAGIPLKYINSNYPLSNLFLNGNQLIKEKKSDGFYIDLKIKAYKSVDNSGGKNIKISKIKEVIIGYPYINNYTINTRKPFYNVQKIELISSEFINVQKTININNNKIYWMNIIDGDKIFEIDIPIGNYNSKLLEKTIEEEMNNIKIISYSINHNINVNINLSKNIVSFKSTLLIKKDNGPFIIENIVFNNKDRIQIHIDDFEYLINIGDKIKIYNAISTNNIPSNILNGTFTITKRTNKSIYFLLPIFNKNNTIENNGGGDNVTIEIPFMIKLLFNYDNTIGGILGFKDVNNEMAITTYSSYITNKHSYINDYTNDITTTNEINLTNNQNYILMYLNNYNNILNNSQYNIFSKILINGNPGDFLFNTFVVSPLEFNPPLKQISSFDIKFFDSDGNYIDFYNQNHSFTLKIVENIKYPNNNQ
jgi:hypothetical protein